jgi:hypothetical protein
MILQMSDTFFTSSMVEADSFYHIPCVQYSFSSIAQSAASFTLCMDWSYPTLLERTVRTFTTYAIESLKLKFQCFKVLVLK